MRKVKRIQNRESFGLRTSVGIFFLIVWSFLAASQAEAVPNGYKLLWNDEFKQADGSAPVSQKWSYTLQKDNQDEVEVYTTRIQNASIVTDPQAQDGKALKIQAVKEANGSLTSARIVTQNKFSFQYGWVECLAKLPGGQGMWPAFWM